MPLTLAVSVNTSTRHAPLVVERSSCALNNANIGALTLDFLFTHNRRSSLGKTADDEIGPDSTPVSSITPHRVIIYFAAHRFKVGRLGAMPTFSFCSRHTLSLYLAASFSDLSPKRITSIRYGETTRGNTGFLPQSTQFIAR